MRDKNILLETFDDIKILQQFLYMDESHTVSMTNMTGAEIRIRMTDDLTFLAQNMMFPDVPEMNFDSELRVNTFRVLIQQLKQSPAIEFPSRFKNRWDEIKTITEENLALNRDL